MFSVNIPFKQIQTVLLTSLNYSLYYNYICSCRRFFILKGKLLKVGFVSFHLLQKHSIGHLLGRVICQLAQNENLVIYVVFMGIQHLSEIPSDIYDCKTPGKKGPSGIQMIIGGADYPVIKARDIILKEKFDVIVYPALGMDITTSYLATLRLAPVQAAWWGHPETSGQINTIDWFITCDGTF